MNQPLVSVIIPVKDGERFLAQAVNSVLGQDYEPLEIIIVDGQSVDKTAEIAKSFEAVRYISQVDRGIADAWNVGIDAASGEFVAFLSHDDLWTPDKLSVQVNYMHSHPEFQYTITMVRFFLEPGYDIPPGFRKELLEGYHVGRIMETLVAHKAVFDGIGGFNPDLSSAEDVDWFARANDKNIPMAIIPAVLLHKRVHDTNLSMNIPTNNRDLLKALQKSIVRKREREATGDR